MATIIILLIGIALLISSVTIILVPQQEAFVVERLGKFHKVLNSGLNFIIPFIDRVAYRHTLTRIDLFLPNQACTTLDNIALTIVSDIGIQVIDPKLASYSNDDYSTAITELAQTILNSVINKKEMENVFIQREEINMFLLATLGDTALRWGIKVLRYQLVDIIPPADVLQALHERFKAEREQRERNTTTNGSQIK